MKPWQDDLIGVLLRVVVAALTAAGVVTLAGRPVERVCVELVPVAAVGSIPSGSLSSNPTPLPSHQSE